MTYQDVYNELSNSQFGEDCLPNVRKCILMRMKKLTPDGDWDNDSKFAEYMAEENYSHAVQDVYRHIHHLRNFPGCPFGNNASDEQIAGEIVKKGELIKSLK